MCDNLDKFPVTDNFLILYDFYFQESSPSSGNSSDDSDFEIIDINELKER